MPRLTVSLSSEAILCPQRGGDAGNGEAHAVMKMAIPHVKPAPVARDWQLYAALHRPRKVAQRGETSRSG